jgi:hypothetical protein
MDAWDAAVLQFSTNLSPDDQVYLTSTKPEDIISDIAKFEESHKKSSKTRHLSAKVQPLVNAISDYGKAMDVMVNCSSVIPPLWGSLRIVVLVSAI